MSRPDSITSSVRFRRNGVTRGHLPGRAMELMGTVQPRASLFDCLTQMKPSNPVSVFRYENQALQLNYAAHLRRLCSIVQPSVLAKKMHPQSEEPPHDGSAP
jgi:hypothetical protein